MVCANSSPYFGGPKSSSTPPSWSFFLILLSVKILEAQRRSMPYIGNLPRKFAFGCLRIMRRTPPVPKGVPKEAVLAPKENVFLTGEPLVTVACPCGMTHGVPCRVDHSGGAIGPPGA